MSSYETQTTTTTSTSTIGPHFDYLRTIPGILKIVEIGLSILTLICASVNVWFVHYYGGGWVQFVAISAFLSTLLLFILNFMGLRTRLPEWAVLVVLSLITFICACFWYWGGSQDWVQFVSFTAFLSTVVYLVLHLFNLISRFPGPWLLIEFIYYCVFTVFFLISAIVCAVKASYHGAVAAATFFAFGATAVYAVDTFFQFRAWRTGQTEMTTTTHTTKTTTTVESNEQY